MTTITEIRPDHSGTDDDEFDDLVHVAATCCPPYERALCGRELDGEHEILDDTGKGHCVVCYEMDRAGVRCSRCGRR